jgi:hypothetical protein
VKTPKAEAPVAAAPLAPDRRPLTESQAVRLSELSGISARDLAGKAAVEILEKFKWQIDPELFLFRRICGKVVKRDPVTGTEYPVPFATVHVEDTDCSFLGLFPVENPWAWFFPITCRREEIGSVVTDRCGRFCVWVPRWEIDWILRFRRERFCWGDIFVRPDIRDLLDHLREIPPRRPPKPEPDPPPFLLRDGGIALRRAEELLGRETAGRLAAIEAGSTIGSSALEQQRILASPAFPAPVPPPIPAEFRLEAKPVKGGQDKYMDTARSTLATRLNLDASVLSQLDFRKFIGPFRRCIDIIVAEWVPIIDVPDITFRVTQDVDGDGTEEVIYSEGFFDVRWNAGAIPDVTLFAAPIAVAGRACDAPDVPCQNTPAIEFAGRMPLVNPAGPTDPYHDAAGGYARRPNRPHPSGAFIDPLPNPLAEAPFTRVLDLYGCNRVAGASFYRLRYRFNGGPLAPFVGLSWPLWRLFGGVLQQLWPASDANGWYPILAAADGWFPDLLLLEWDTRAFPDGLYTVQLELGDGAKNPVGAPSAAVGLRIDNSAPNASFTQLRWRKLGGAFQPLPLICPLIPRGVVPSDIEIEVSYSASAPHLRSVSLSGGGCGAEAPTLSSALSTAQHWHTSAADNAVADTAIFSLSAAAPPGAYSFFLVAASRAFNPSGGDGGALADWNYDPVYNYVTPMLPVAVVNA